MLWRRSGGDRVWLHPSSSQMRSIVRAQAIVRGFLARRRVHFLRAMEQHRIRRSDVRTFAHSQQRRLALHSIEERLVLTELYTHCELAAAEEDQRAECR